jgi:hypothetical protein
MIQTSQWIELIIEQLTKQNKTKKKKKNLEKVFNVMLSEILLKLSLNFNVSHTRLRNVNQGSSKHNRQTDLRKKRAGMLSSRGKRIITISHFSSFFSRISYDSFQSFQSSFWF